MTEKIVVKELFKIFGPSPETALKMLEKGLNKDEIHSKTGNTVAVHDANFSIMSSEIFVIMGLSGSGKSTIVRMFNRLIEPTSGTVLVDGEDVTGMDKKSLIRLRRKDMSMVFQSFALMPRMQVWENAAFGLEVAGFSPRERRDSAFKALDQVGLKGYEYSYPGELSGGMQQRVGLARALALDPGILLMDEAFSALDPLIRTEMQDELLSLQEDLERTIVFISHDLDEAMRIGDRIAIMEGGRIVQVGTPDEILQNPGDEYVRSFFRGVDPTKVLCAGDIMRDLQVTIPRRPGSQEGIQSALQRLRDFDREVGYVLDKKKRFQGIVTVDTLERASRGDTPRFQDALVDDPSPVRTDTPLSEVLPVVTRSAFPVPVVDENNVYRGTISKVAYLEALKRGED